MNLRADPAVVHQLDTLDADPRRARLTARVNEILVALEEDPIPRWVRRRRMQSPPVWVVTISDGDEEWVLLWQALDEGDAHLVYLGPSTFA